MYRRKATGWRKYYDFALYDLICLEFSYWIAFRIKFGQGNPFQTQGYNYLNLCLLLMYFIGSYLLNNMTRILTRSVWKELQKCISTAAFVVMSAVLWIFSLQDNGFFSRTVIFITGLLFFLSTFTYHTILKKQIQKNGRGRKLDSILIAANKEHMPQILATLQVNSTTLPTIHGLIVFDGTPGMDDYAPYTVVANQDTMIEYITHNWVDELLVKFGDLGDDDLQKSVEIYKMLDIIADSGVAVHKIICSETNMNGRSQCVESVGGFAVLTDTIRIITLRQSVSKRALDIVGGLVGSFIALIIIGIVGPMVYVKSPGPILFKQTRVGKNGKLFTMYKIRSMYLDAEERKKEYLAQNRISSGMMFKLENDPRIIGSQILPDGTYKRGIGNIIRDYSLDEFPNFFNVLRGDMSLVGTRPPTLDEWEKYSPQHRARMALRPGITGLWQISGRSNLTDFDEVIKLDLQYISTRTTGMDFNILLKTIVKVIKKDGAR